MRENQVFKAEEVARKGNGSEAAASSRCLLNWMCPKLFKFVD